MSHIYVLVNSYTEDNEVEICKVSLHTTLQDAQTAMEKAYANDIAVARRVESVRDSYLTGFSAGYQTDSSGDIWEIFKKEIPYK